MSKSKIGRNGETLVQDLGDGRKVSFTQASDGPRANLHEGGITRSVDPADFAVRAVEPSEVGGGHRRITLTTTDGQAVDHTQRRDGTLDEQTHKGGTTRKSSHPGCRIRWNET